MPEKIINLTSSEYEQWSLFTKSDTDTSHKYFRPSYFIFSVIILCVVEEKTYFLYKSMQLIAPTESDCGFSHGVKVLFYK